ncbi:gp37 [Bacillus phage SPO1]|uniref:Putative gene 37 protein n=2 Tax=Bacillus phage SP01 TaxID=2884427 RepID=GP37_BPSP1|nr:gp37 [Bacillus phage SPO1]O48393.1 RecName: Full=Putative gene 37 protein [Bacillus phage SPO1]AAC29006.1 unknown [Bacillus phage SPO1]ACI90910.1 gp37 [Bacillus phage SPO1]
MSDVIIPFLTSAVTAFIVAYLLDRWYIKRRR